MFIRSQKWWNNVSIKILCDQQTCQKLYYILGYLHHSPATWSSWDILHLQQQPRAGLTLLLGKKKKSCQNQLIFAKINVQCTMLCWYSFLSTWLWICFCYKTWRHQTGNFCPLWERLLPLSGRLFSLWCAQDPCGHCWLKLTCCTDFFLPKWRFILSRCKEKQRHWMGKLWVLLQFSL